MSIYNSARWANNNRTGVLLVSEKEPTFYVDSGPLYEKAISGAFGVIADPIIEGPSAEDIRTYRDHLLVASDWTQVADAPVDQVAWATYRQALRNVPQKDGFPADVVWPTKP